ncbi:MAG: hypothetical protein WCN81_13175, partial [Actinomycetes bacterium]
IFELLARVVEVGEEMAAAKLLERGKGGVHCAYLLRGVRESRLPVFGPSRESCLSGRTNVHYQS